MSKATDTLHMAWEECKSNIYCIDTWIILQNEIVKLEADNEKLKKQIQLMSREPTAARTVDITPTEAFPEVPVVFEKPPTIYERQIQEHGGGKYLRKIYSADGNGGPINIDVYCVIEAFGISCPALQHALKKVLACGQRGKGDKVADIQGVFDAMWRALELEKQRQQNTVTA